MKESYVFEDEKTGFREEYDIKVSDGDCVDIIITDNKKRVSFPSWDLIKKLYERIDEHINYQQDMKNGVCPECKTVNLMYNEMKTIPNGVIYPYECLDCNHQGGAVYKAVFLGME